LVFKDPADYEKMEEGMTLEMPDIFRRIQRGDIELPVSLEGKQIMAVLEVSERQRKSLLAGGTLNYVRQELGNRS
jgi:aconitate hydratase